MSISKTSNKTKSTKRRNGEGSIQELENGKFMGKIMLGRQPDGKPNRKSVYGKTQAEVLNKINELKYEYSHGIYIEPNRTKLGEWLIFWLKTYKQKKIKPRTYDTYESQINANIITSLGHIMLKDLNTNHIQHFYNKLYDDGNGLSSATIRKIHQIINSALKKAQSIDMIGKNPATYVELPVFEQKLVKAFSREEQEAFFEAAKGFDYYNAYLFDVDTGIREGELLALNWKDIDFQKGLVHINKTLVFVKDRKSKSGKVYLLQVQDSTKTKAGTRTIPLTKRCLTILKELKLKNGFKSQLVFPSRKGTFIDPSNFQRCFLTICKRAGLEGYSCHTLRHTFATRCFENNINVKIVSKWLGHKKISHTLDIYTHVLPDKDMEAIEMLENGTFKKQVAYNVASEK